MNNADQRMCFGVKSSFVIDHKPKNPAYPTIVIRFVYAIALSYSTEANLIWASSISFSVPVAYGQHFPVELL